MSAQTFHRDHRLLAVAGSILLFASAHIPLVAAAPKLGAEPAPAERQRQDAEYQTRMSNALLLGRGSNAGAVESEVTQLNRTRPNTAAWHMETAQRLVQVAGRLAREGQTGMVPALARSAIAHTDDAYRKATDPRARSSARSLAGFIQERYLADQDSALASYREAAQLAPTAAGRAREAIGRLENARDRQRGQKSGGAK